MNTSVVSAAIIEGNLIIGLSDGSVINCGYVQGPQGLTGPEGPMGSPGDRGTDGNTIHTIAGTPGNDIGKDGDYAIDNINWRIYGPKSGGVWGKAKEMLPGPENILENGRAPSGSGGGSMGGSGSGSGGGGGIVYTNTVQLTNPVTTLLRSTANYKIIPNAPAGTTNQQGANLWGFGACFDNFDAAIPVATGVVPPTPLPGFADNWDGRLWFDSNEDELTLYIYNNGAWIPAAPPVSIDGINATIDAALVVQSDLLERVTVGEETQAQITNTVSDALVVQSDLIDEQEVQNSQINALETQIQLLSGVKAVGKWTYRRRVESSAPRPPASATFYGTHKDGVDNVLLNWSDTYLLMINKTDIEGNNYTFSDFEEGDKVEIIATDGSSAVYGTITNNPSNDVYGNMIIDVERFRSGPVEEKEYLISAYRPGSSNGNVDLDILDDRYLVKTGDDMGDNAYINFPGGGIHFKHTDGEKKAYFYNAAEGITQWTAYNGTQLKVTARDGDPGGGRTYIDIKTANSSGTGGEDTGYRMRLYHVADPTEDLHGVNKRYVDQNSQLPTPARFRWQWVGKAEDHAGNSLSSGEFSGPQLGNGTTSSGLVYYLNLTALNASHKIYSRPNDESMSFPEAMGGPLLSLWSDPVTAESSTIALMCVQRVKKIKFHGTNYETDGGFIEIETHQGSGHSHTFSGTGLFYNKHYYIQLAGIF